MLKDYVENIANRIIQEREIANKEPYVLATDIFCRCKGRYYRMYARTLPRG